MQKVLNWRNVYVQDVVQKHCAQVLLNVKVLIEFKSLGTNGRSSLPLTLANDSMEVMMEIRRYSRSRFVLAQGDNNVFALQHYVSSTEHDVFAFWTKQVSEFCTVFLCNMNAHNSRLVKVHYKKTLKNVSPSCSCSECTCRIPSVHLWYTSSTSTVTMHDMLIIAWVEGLYANCWQLQARERVPILWRIAHTWMQQLLL